MSKPTKLSRKEFLRLVATSLGAVTAARLLAACSPTSPTLESVPAASTVRPAPKTSTLPDSTATSAPLPNSVPANTTIPVAPAATTEATVTITPTAPGALGNVRRPEVIKFYPDAASQLVRVHHSGAWDGDKLVPDALRQMLDAGITHLTGINDANQAWAALFSPNERIAIKVNTILSSSYWTPVPLVMAVTQSLQDAGVPAEQIVIYDRDPSELGNAGFKINRDGPGVRCASSTRYVKGYKLVGIDASLSDVLLSCDALINMPILKSHGNAGMTFSMKNHYGTFQRPTEFYHSGKGIQQGIAELNAWPDIKNRTRLIVGSLLNFVGASSWDWSNALPGDSLLFSFDPVAADAYAMQEFQKVVTLSGPSPKTIKALATPWIAYAAKLGVGTNDPAHYQVNELSL
jgi:hypothetical protein